MCDMLVYIKEIIKAEKSSSHLCVFGNRSMSSDIISKTRYRLIRETIRRVIKLQYQHAHSHRHRVSRMIETIPSRVSYEAIIFLEKCASLHRERRLQ